MKPSILTVIIFYVLCSFGDIKSQECYTILKVKGSIYNQSKGKNVAVNDELCSSDKLIFSSLNDAVAVHSTSKGRLTLKPVQGDQRSELEYIMSDAVALNIGLLSSRGPRDPADTVKQKVQFGAKDILSSEFKNEYYVIGNNYAIKNEYPDYPMNEKSYFCIAYVYNNDTLVKKLDFQGSNFILGKEKIYSANGEAVNQDEVESVNLYYITNNESKELISSFKLIFLEEKELKQELENLISRLKSENNPKMDIYKEVLSYMQDIYGNFNLASFESWYKLNFKE